MANSISYQQAASSCKSDGKELCNSKAICKDGKTPFGGVRSGDHWVPVVDSSNEWIQIGKKRVNDISKKGILTDKNFNCYFAFVCRKFSTSSMCPSHHTGLKTLVGIKQCCLQF